MSVSLKESCLRILTAHSSGLIDVGNCSYGLIRPILFACPPDQLAEIEDRSPHLMLESDEIWALHLKRDYPSETASSPVKHTLSTSTSSECDLQEVDLPPNRLKYFDTRASKEQALASASARLRERTLANRSDTTKRKAIFTGETDRGLGSKRKKLGGSRSWGTPGGTAPKTLAEKARQQVKKSAAVYAHASRPTPPPIASSSIPRLSSKLSTAAPSSTPSMFAPRRSPNNPASRCVVRKASVVVKVVSGRQLVVPVQPVSGTVKPTPFGACTRLASAPVRTVVPIAPTTKAGLDPVTRVQTQVSGSNASPKTSLSVGSSPASAARKPSSLFMPKAKKPPPPAPSRSLVSVPAPKSTSTIRMSQPPRK